MESSRLPAALLVAALYFLSFGSTQAQLNLTAVKCAGKLPTGRLYSAVLYDRNDSIYIFGGGAQTDFDDVIKYSISQDTTELVGQLPYPDYGGGAVINKQGDIFYISGRLGKDIHQYIPELRSFTNVSSLPEDNNRFATIIPDDDTALLIGGLGDPRGIMSLNLNTLETENIGQLPENANNPAAIWDAEKNTGYIFNRQGVLKYSRAENRTERLFLIVPIDSLIYPAVWDGRFANLIGKMVRGNPPQSLLRFDPETETITFLPIEGYMPMSSVSAVYIGKLNRIYMLSGYSQNENGTDTVYHDEIYYVDLSPRKE